jgi:hypothetical protein
MTLHQLRSMPVSPPRAEPYNKPGRGTKNSIKSDFHSPMLLLLLWIFLISIELQSRYTVVAKDRLAFSLSLRVLEAGFCQNLFDPIGNNSFLTREEIVRKDPKSLPRRTKLCHVTCLNRGFSVSQELDHF